MAIRVGVNQLGPLGVDTPIGRRSEAAELGHSCCCLQFEHREND
jgi:hypothetical protein